MNSNFNPVKNFWFWCQKVLPLVYDDSISYYEVLCKMSEYLNQTINNVNALPDIIDEAIKNYIESGDIQSALNEMLQNFNPINVKTPPANLVAAKGDGTTDDTAALQAMINYGAEHNLPMIFPAGIYRVSSLNIPKNASFLGMSGATIFKTENSDNALINVSGNFSAFNIAFNGNIGGNINPKEIITGTSTNIALNACNFSGSTTCVDINIAELAEINMCHFENYTDCAVSVEGTGRTIITAMTVERVANSGANYFVKFGTSNSIINELISLAEIPTGIMVTGDFNDIKARIPNCENPVSDGGQHNNINIIAYSQKISVSRDINLTTEKIDINSSEIMTNADIATEKIKNNKTTNANDIALTAEQSITATGTDIALTAEQSITATGTDIALTAEQSITATGTDIALDPKNPLTYKTPSKINEYFNAVQFKTQDNTTYDVLVAGEKFNEFTLSTIKNNVKEFGAKGDGITDDTDAIFNAIEKSKESGLALFFPSGIYMISKTINLWDGAVIEGQGMFNTVIRAIKGQHFHIIEWNYAVEQRAVNNVLIENLTIDGNIDNTGEAPESEYHGIRIYGCNHFTLLSVRCMKNSGYGAGFQGRPDSTPGIVQRDIRILNCVFTTNGISKGNEGPTPTMSDGIDFKYGENVTIDGCVADNNTDGGIDCRGFNFRISNCYTSSNGRTGINTRAPFTGVITNCVCERNGLSGLTLNPNDGYDGVPFTNYATASNCLLNNNDMLIAKNAIKNEIDTVYSVSNVVINNGKLNITDFWEGTKIAVDNVLINGSSAISEEDPTPVSLYSTGTTGNVTVKGLKIMRSANGIKTEENSNITYALLENYATTPVINNVAIKSKYQIYPETE